MNDLTNQLIGEAENYVRSFLQKQDSCKRTYHNLNHTEAVVKAADEIASHYQLQDDEYQVVMISAWFHDIGYFIDPDHHEQAGAEAAIQFLNKRAASPDMIDRVKGCIMATKLPQNPQNLLEAITADADLFHLGKDSFKATNRLMCQEKELCLGKRLSKQQWRLGTIKFLESHHYHTDYAKMLLEDTKAAHLANLKNKAAVVATKQQQEQLQSQYAAESLENEKETQVASQLSAPEEKLAGKQAASIGSILNNMYTPTTSMATSLENNETDKTGLNTKKDKKKDKKAKKEEKPDKGIETMFRVTAGNNQKLSNMADNKAHILISVNSIILSAVISLLLRKLDSNESLAIPTFILITVSLVTIIFSILSTRPTIPKGTFTDADIAEKKTNLLFFGNFYKMDLDQYTKGMWKVMDDRDFLYGSLIKDVYYQGVVLGKKYRLLRTAYNVFMYGLILAVIAYMISVSVSI